MEDERSRCPRCGAAWSAGASWCPQCGERSVAPPAPVFFLCGSALADTVLGIFLGGLPVALGALASLSNRGGVIVAGTVVPLGLVLAAFYIGLKPYRSVRQALAVTLAAWLGQGALVGLAMTRCAFVDPLFLLFLPAGILAATVVILVLREAFRS